MSETTIITICTIRTAHASGRDIIENTYYFYVKATSDDKNMSFTFVCVWDILLDKKPPRKCVTKTFSKELNRYGIIPNVKSLKNPKTNNTHSTNIDLESYFNFSENKIHTKKKKIKKHFLFFYKLLDRVHSSVFQLYYTILSSFINNYVKKMYMLTITGKTILRKI